MLSRSMSVFPAYPAPRIGKSPASLLQPAAEFGLVAVLSGLVESFAFRAPYGKLSGYLSATGHLCPLSLPELVPLFSPMSTLWG